MEQLDYQIFPVKMKGTIKKVFDDKIKVFLHGRLGVIIVPKDMVRQDEELVPGHVLQFYFSYIRQVESPYDYDIADLTTDHEIDPVLTGGKIIESNDTAVKVQIMNQIGTIAVPRRWLFSYKQPDVGQDVEFYLSCMDIIGKRDIPAKFI